MPCVVGNEKLKPFTDTKDKNYEALDSVSTNTTGPITPANHDGNEYLHMLVDAETRHTQGFPMKKKSDAATVILK